MIKIGLYNKVCSKKTGFPGVGTVVGVSIPRWYYSCQLALVNEDKKHLLCKRWFDLYPDWLDKLLITVFYDSPRRTLTWEEYVSVTPNPTQFEYDSFPKSQNILYPIDDLELFDEEK